MSVCLLVIRLLLAAVFVVAAAGKLVDLDRSRQTIEQFGLSARLARPLGLLLPLTELVIGVALIPVSTASWAALAAMGLLGVFCVALARVLVRGEAPDCNCFGSIGSAPVGRATLVRNGVLIVLAGFVAVAGLNDRGVSALAWIADYPALAVVAGVFAAVSAIHIAFSWQLFQQNGRLLDRLSDLEVTGVVESISSSYDGLVVGDPAPDFVLPDLEGRSVTLDDLLAAGRGALLFFTNPSCAACDPLLPAFGHAQSVAHGVPVAIISSGAVDDNRAKAEGHVLTQVLLQDSFEVAESYHVYGSPGAVLVGETGRIASERATGAQSVTELLDAISGSRLRAVAAPTVGAGELAAASAR